MSNSTKGARSQHLNKKKCPFCSKMLSNVGYTNHIRSKHPDGQKPIPADIAPEIRSAIDAIDRKIQELQSARSALLSAFPFEPMRKPVKGVA